MTEPRAEAYAPGGTAEPWTSGRQRLAEADTYWLATTTPSGRPHLVPVLAVWVDEAPHFVAASGSRKARDLARRPECSLATNHDGVDLVVDGIATIERSDEVLTRVSDAYSAKYNWPTTVRDGALTDQEGAPTAGPPPYDVYRVRPTVIFGFPSDESFSPTRWRFDPS
jgi:nitroimidazol reductase NimA-like FMN-containing flavoprotein (pyridoxamine 5'-phosphate oxidase superfamily)